MKVVTRTRPGRPNYYIVLEYKDPETGKDKAKWLQQDIPVKGNNKRAIEERRKEIEAEYESQDPEAPAEPDLRGDTLFTDYIIQWLESQRVALADTTYQCYEHQVCNRIVPYFLPKKIKLKDLTPKELVKFMNDELESFSNNTVRKHLINISTCLDSAAKEPNRIIPFNPAKVIEWPKKEEFMGAMIYDEAQIIKLLEVSKGDPMELMLLITVYYGLRRSDAYVKHKLKIFTDIFLRPYDRRNARRPMASALFSCAIIQPVSDSATPGQPPYLSVPVSRTMHSTPISSSSPRKLCTSKTFRAILAMSETITRLTAPCRI
jgi:hypothetical protein